MHAAQRATESARVGVISAMAKCEDGYSLKLFITHGRWLIQQRLVNSRHEAIIRVAHMQDSTFVKALRHRHA
jgi:hypothetical protein